MPLKLISSGGGSVILDANTTASTYTVNVPAEGGSMLTTGSLSGVNASAMSVGTIPQLRMPAGNVLGMAYGLNPYRAGAGQILSTSSTSFVDTGIYCTYTPKRSNSLLLVQCIVQSHSGGVSTNQGIQYKIYRDGTNLTTGLGGNAESAAFYHDSGHTRDFYGTFPFGWVTTSNSTTTTTFRIYVAAWIDSSAIRINGHDGQSMITVMEIAQ